MKRGSRFVCTVCKKGSKLKTHPSCANKGVYGHVFRLKRKVFDIEPPKIKHVLYGVYKINSNNALHKSLNTKTGFRPKPPKYDANDIWRI